MATVNTNWTSPASATLDKATGATIDETMTDALASNLYHLGGAGGFIGARAFVAAPQSIATGTDTAVAMAGENFDADPNGAMHDTVTNNSRITVQTGGVYHVSASIQFASNATGYRMVQIRVNGGALAELQAIVPAVSGQATQVALHASVALNATNYVEAWVHQTSGGALNVSGGGLSVVKA